MIRGAGHYGDGRKFVLLGVDQENVKRLTAGHPIKVSGEPLGLNADVFIVFGATLQDVVNEISAAGISLPTETIKQ